MNSYQATQGLTMYNNTPSPSSVNTFAQNSGKLKPTNRHNPCPVCDNIDGRCRTTDTELVLCMESEGDHNGYKDWGKSSDGMWTKYAPQKDWKAEKPYNPRKVSVNIPDRLGLSAKELDFWNRKLLSFLTLHPDDLAECYRRGLTDEQVQRWGIKSVKRFQQLPEVFPDNLPGVAKGGRSLVNKVEGYLTPIYDADNYLVGFQVRDRNPEVLEDGRISGKYKWLSTTANPVRLDSTGELPLTVFGKGQNIAMVEGLGAKPFLLSERLGVTAIGAAGGNFNPSSKTLIQTLRKLAGLGLGQTSLITFYPDAGAVKNRHVLNQYFNTFDLLIKEGFKFDIAWWEQLTKGVDLDIDELQDLSLIKSISKSEFEAIARKHCPKFFESRDKAKPKEKLNPQETAIAKKIISIVPGSTPVNPLETQAHESQFKLWETFTTKFTHNYEICSKYLSVDLFKDKINVKTWGMFGRSPLGSGKSYMLKPGDNTPGLIAHVEDLHGYTVENPVGGNVLGHRNTLLGQTGEALGAKFIGDVSEAEKKKPGAWFLACVNSMEKFPSGHFKGKILILDELISVIEHMIVGSTCYKNRSVIFNGFTEAVRDSIFVACLDANMADWAVNFITDLRKPTPEDNVLILNNLTQPKDTGVEVIATFSQKEITQKIMELAPLYYAKGQSIAVTTDSQAFLEKICDILTKMGFYVLRLDSKTTHLSQVIAFIKKPESVPRPFCLGYSPVCDSGLNVGDPNYVHVFAYFCGVVGTASQVQMLRRPRAAVKMTISCVPYTRMNLSSAARKSEYIEDQKAAFLSTEKYFPAEMFQEAKAKWEASEEGIHYKTLWDLKFYRNYERKNTLECLIQILKVHGYSPVLIEDGATTGQLKEELEDHRRVEAIAIAEASIITDEDAEVLEGKSPWTQQEMREYRAWEIRREFPDNWQDNHKNPEWIFEKDTELINKFNHKEKLQEVGRLIQVKEATGIYKANDITVRQAESLRTKMALTPLERYELDRYTIKQELTGIQYKDDGKFWNIDSIIEIRKRLYNITDLKIRWAYENLEKAREMRTWKWISDLEEDRFIGDCLQNYYGKAKLLQELKLDELPEEFDGNSELVKELAEIARSKKVRLRQTLGAVKGQMENIPWVKKLLGIMGKKIAMTGRTRGESRTYKVAEDDELGKAIYDCVSATLEKQYQHGLETCHAHQDMVHNQASVVQDLEIKSDTGNHATQKNAPQEVVIVSGDVEVAKIRRYDRFLYRGHEAIFIKTLFGDLDFYFPLLQRVISIAPAYTGELIRLEGLPSVDQRNYIEQNIA